MKSQVVHDKCPFMEFNIKPIKLLPIMLEIFWEKCFKEIKSPNKYSYAQTKMNVIVEDQEPHA